MRVPEGSWTDRSCPRGPKARRMREYSGLTGGIGLSLEGESGHGEGIPADH